MFQKICCECGEQFNAERPERKYCSFACYWKFRLKNPVKRKYTAAQLKQHSLNNKGSKNPAWVGNKIQYFGVHTWIKRHFGNPQYCEHCKRTNKKKYEWANINHRYRRVKKDYLRLCVSCHRKYDIEKNGYYEKWKASINKNKKAA